MEACRHTTEWTVGNQPYKLVWSVCAADGGRDEAGCVWRRETETADALKPSGDVSGSLINRQASTPQA